MVGRQACPQNGVLLAGMGDADHLHKQVTLLEKKKRYSTYLVLMVMKGRNVDSKRKYAMRALDRRAREHIDEL